MASPQSMASPQPIASLQPMACGIATHGVATTHGVAATPGIATHDIAVAHGVVTSHGVAASHGIATSHGIDALLRMPPVAVMAAKLQRPITPRVRCDARARALDARRCVGDGDGGGQGGARGEGAGRARGGVRHSHVREEARGDHLDLRITSARGSEGKSCHRNNKQFHLFDFGIRSNARKSHMLGAATSATSSGCHGQSRIVALWRCIVSIRARKIHATPMWMFEKLSETSGRPCTNALSRKNHMSRMVRGGEAGMWGEG